MSKSWRVTHGGPQVVGVDPTATGLLLIDVPLTPSPDEYWRAIFGGSGFFDAPPGFSLSISMHPPRLYGDSVRLRAPDGELDRYIESLDARIAATNDEYERRVLPELERQNEVRRSEQDELKSRLEEAQRKLDEGT